jgi:protein phosphatase
VLLVAALVGAAFLGYRYTQTRYYVGFDGDSVAIYQGVQGTVGPIRLSHVVQVTDVTRSQLGSFTRSQIAETISAPSMDAAETVVDNARTDSGG